MRELRLGVPLLAVALALGAAGDVLFNGRQLGINVLLFAACFVAALALLLRKADAPAHQGRRWMAAPLLIFAAAFAWHDSRLLTATNLLALAGTVALGGLRRTQHRPQDASVSEYAVGFASAGVGTFAGAVHLLTQEIPWRAASRGVRGARAAAVGRGVAIGLPFVLLFGGLFMAADAVFKQYVTDAVPSFGHPASHIVFVTVIAWMGAGLLRDLVARREEERALPADWLLQRKAARLGSTEIAIVLGALDLLFLAFVLVQARYLFGGTALVESQAGLTYAQYARHGFFELVAVSVLVLPVLLAANALARDRERLVRALSGVLVALELVVAVSALQRLRIYEQQYGLTELRVYAIGVVGWLVCVFLWASVTILRGRVRRFAVGAVVAGFAATAALNVLNPDGLIARTNLTRPQADLVYLQKLSDDAVPTLVAQASSSRDPAVRAALRAQLSARRVAPFDWLSWNASRERARHALTQLPR
ncbi:MAG: DUF4153 domain-containing protein [Gaiellaceae bacterium]